MPPHDGVVPPELAIGFYVATGLFMIGYLVSLVWRVMNARRWKQRRAMSVFLDWYVPAVRDRQVRADERRKTG